MQNMYLLKFPAESSSNLLTYDLVKKFDLKINILRASIEFDAKGFLLIDIVSPMEAIEEAIEYIEENGVEVIKITAAIHVDDKKCVDCGACTAVCNVGALIMDESYTLVFDNEKCVDCKACISACPARAISAVF